MRPDRAVLMSTHGPRSAGNAAKSLATPLDLTPIHDRLAGTPAATLATGYLWAFKSGTLVMRDPQPLQAGDLCVTTTRTQVGDLVVARLFPVAAVLPDAPEIPALLDVHWAGTGWGNIVVLDEPQLLDPPITYAALDAAFDIRPGAMFAAKFLRPGADELLDWIAGTQAHDHPAPAAAAHPDHPVTTVDPASTETTTRRRLHASTFKTDVYRHYGTACAACDFTAICSAAHLKDWAKGGPDTWWNGLPLCPNHHALLDRGRLRLHPQTRQWTSGHGTPDLTSLGVTRADINHLPNAPLPELLQWKWDHPTTGGATT